MLVDIRFNAFKHLIALVVIVDCFAVLPACCSVVLKAPVNQHPGIPVVELGERESPDKQDVGELFGSQLVRYVASAAVDEFFGSTAISDDSIGRS